MDIQNIKERIMELNVQIAEVLQEAGYPDGIEYGGNDSDTDSLRMELMNVLSHLGYANVVIGRWSRPGHD